MSQFLHETADQHPLCSFTRTLRAFERPTMCGCTRGRKDGSDRTISAVPFGHVVRHHGNGSVYAGRPTRGRGVGLGSEDRSQVCLSSCAGRREGGRGVEGMKVVPTSRPAPVTQASPPRHVDKTRSCERGSNRKVTRKPATHYTVLLPSSAVRPLSQIAQQGDGIRMYNQLIG